MSDSLLDESQVHETTITELIGHYGRDIDHAEIRKVYQETRERHEAEARIKSFLPVIIKREVKKILSAKRSTRC